MQLLESPIPPLTAAALRRTICIICKTLVPPDGHLQQGWAPRPAKKGLRPTRPAKKQVLPRPPRENWQNLRGGAKFI